MNNGSSRIRLLIVDDHTIIREGLVSLLSVEPAIDVVGQGADGIEAVELASALSPDVVLLDISMPRLSGLDAARRILERQPACRILVLTMHDNEEYVAQMARLGAAGYLVKDVVGVELIEAIRTVAAGRTYFASEGAHRPRRLAPCATIGRSDPLQGLTNREREVFQLVVEAKTNPQIAKLLGLSPKTIDNHRTRLMEKLGLHSTAELVRFAARHGLL